MKRILLTGFEPFGGDALNPSTLATRALHGRQVGGHRIVAATLPTVFGAADAALSGLLRAHRPALVLCTGLAGGREGFSLERVAINVNDAPIADNAGARPVDTPVVAGGPAAYFTTLPIKAMLAALQAQGLSAQVSQSAGTFVCNHVFYGLMHKLATGRGLHGTRGGFMHLPWLPEMGSPSLQLEAMVLGLRVALGAALKDVRRPGRPGPPS